ncbi:hypothetical protein [Actinoplanes couchii]|uniref:Uncharacterized protein n=1 Tax=Actinoplanes couchii TaxID=403638 RepID=A0ABQ3XRL8_9ACTN|nr:hypothetical protein [Actinoplanes couchii]MDR6318904.1 hypothetical protein [Actinoplanes couchii]GID61157.1 hypothetical protein Aco03nite_095610 [Actinoplanes couchii]
MSYDPSLVAIAAATNDALPEPLWLRETPTDDDPVTQIAAALGRAAVTFDTDARDLATIFGDLAVAGGRHLTTVLERATVQHDNLPAALTGLAIRLDRFDRSREHLLTLYAMWRRHRPITLEARRQHLLLRPYEPRCGMAELTTDESRLAWWVCPDRVAADAFAIPSRTRSLVGSIWHSQQGWQVTAFTDPHHLAGAGHLVHQLPPADTQDAACRSLLRWWHWWDSPGWENRTPADLSAADRAALAD